MNCDCDAEGCVGRRLRLAFGLGAHTMCLNDNVLAAISLLIFVCDQTLGRFFPRQRLSWANDPLLAYRLHKSRAWIRGKGN